MLLILRLLAGDDIFVNHNHWVLRFRLGDRDRLSPIDLFQILLSISGEHNQVWAGIFGTIIGELCNAGVAGLSVLPPTIK